MSRRQRRAARQGSQDFAQDRSQDCSQISASAAPNPHEGLRAEEPLAIRIAQTHDDIVAIHRFMIAHAAAEMAEAEVDALIYMRTIHDTVTQGAGFMALIAGEIAGYLGLWKSQYDYSKAFFLHDRGFYVLPAHRGAAGAALLSEARAIAQ